MLKIQPPKNLPDHSLLVGTFKTSFYGECHKTVPPLRFNFHQTDNKTPMSTRPKKKNIKKMPADFCMSNEIRDKVFDTINKIERSQATRREINKLWSEIKNLFLSELDKLPSMPVSFNKKQRKLFRKSQPFWNGDLETLWKTACQMEKNYVNFKVQSLFDQNTKAHLRNEFKNAQRIFDKSFRKAQRIHKKQSLHELELSAKQDPTDMWSRLKNLSNPPSS